MTFKFKKYMSFILVFCICFSIATQYIIAQNVQETQQSFLDSEPTEYVANDYATLVKILRKAVLESKEIKVDYSTNGATNIDLKSLWHTIFNSESEGKDYVSDFVDDITLVKINHFIVSGTQISIDQNSCTIAIYNINYSSRTEDNDVNFVNKTLDDIVSKLNLENLTRYEKVVKINDWICDNFKYDQTLKNSSMYNGFIANTMTCTAYANIFFNIANRAGIPCRLIGGTSNFELHSWNLVQMTDGKWYHVDVTWNDALNSKDYLLSGTTTTYKDHTVDSLIRSCLNMYYDIPYYDFVYVSPIDPVVYTYNKKINYNEMDNLDVKVAELKLNDAKGFDMYIDDGFKLWVQIMGSDYSVEVVEDIQIVSLKSSFLNTLPNGTHTISIVFNDERKTSAHFKLKVNKIIIKDEGKTKKLKVKAKYVISKSFGKGYTVKFTSSNKKIIKVSAGGTVTAIKKGKAYIRATVTKGTYSRKFIVKFNISK